MPAPDTAPGTAPAASPITDDAPRLRVRGHQVAVVTGASSGIGHATAIELAGAGFEVWAGARRTERMTGLGAHGIRVLPLDVTDEASMAGFVEVVLAGAGRIDVLVNNAGVGLYGAVEDVTLDRARHLMEVNLFGLARMTQLVLPTMRAQHGGRIVNVSSLGAKVGGPFAAWYHASQFAVEGFSDSLRLEVRPFGIEVVLVEPGVVATEWTSVARGGFVATSAGGAYEKAVRRMARVLAVADRRRLGSSPRVIAETIVAAALAERPNTRYPVGAGARAAVTARRVLPDRAVDAVLGRLA